MQPRNEHHHPDNHKSSKVQQTENVHTTTQHKHKANTNGVPTPSQIASRNIQKKAKMQQLWNMVCCQPG
jgi:hypothetical protein